MKIQCPHCGTANDADPAAVRAGHAMCRRCQSALSSPLDTAAAAPPEIGQPDAAHAWLSALGEPATDWSAPPAPARPAERPYGAVDEDITQGAPMNFGDAGGFLFDQPAADDGESTWLQGGHGPIDFDRRVDPNDDESTRIVANPGKRPMARPASGPAWRIRAERGLVYEMQSVDAVVAWIEGRAEIHGITLAKADGPFQPISAFDEVAKRVGSRHGTKPALVEDDDAPLSLALDPAETRRRAQAPTKPADPVEPRRAGPNRTTTAKASINIANPLGFGTVLAIMLASVALVSGAVVAGMVWGEFETGESSALSVAEPLAGNPQLERAISEIEKGNNSAAEKILRGLPNQQDPRVDRYLALVLHRTDRGREAHEALERYRHSMNRMSGGHGRQVRKVRD
jgi:hypothetical protein